MKVKKEGWGDSISCHVRDDVSLTSPDVGKPVIPQVTLYLLLSRFSSNFVHLPPHKTLEKRVCHVTHPTFFNFLFRKFYLTENLTRNGKWCVIRVYKKTTYRSFTQLHLSKFSTISATDLVRKHSGDWDKENPKCLFCGKTYRFRTFTVQCHVTSEVTDQGSLDPVTPTRVHSGTPSVVKISVRQSYSYVCTYFLQYTF